jgi:hypothetical protein
MVQAQRGYTVGWRFVSLRMINAAVDYDSHFPPGYEAGHTAGLKLLRVAARTRAELGRAAVGALYAALGARILDTPADSDQPDGGYRGTRAFLAPVPAGTGLRTELADALEDASFDAEIGRETDEALALTGKDVGTPIIQFQPPAGVAFSGPVIGRLPSAAEAVPLWDNVLGLASFPGFAELKRSLRERPQLRCGSRPGRRPGGLVRRPLARSGIALRSRGSRRGEDVGHLNVRIFGQQARAGLAERGGDRAVQVRLPPGLVAEGVENAEGGVAELEGVPGDRAGLGRSQRLGLGQEGGELVFLARLGLQDDEQSSVDAHERSFRWVRDQR